MRRYSSRKSVFIGRLCAAFAIIAALTAFIVHRRIEQYAEIICKSSCIRYGESVINNAVAEAMGSADFSLVLTADGKTYTTNASAVNQIQIILTECIIDTLENEMHSAVSVPAGAFTGLSFLSGSGPEINIDIFSVASPSVCLQTNFESAGVNQTLFELTAIVTMEFSAVLPTESIPVSVVREVLLSQQIIVGDVPQFFLD